MNEFESLGDDDEVKGPKGGKKIRATRSLSKAKTLNDSEQRRLGGTIARMSREFRNHTHNLDRETDALRLQLLDLNPEFKLKDPANNIIVPRGLSREQAEKLKEGRRKSMPVITKSISLAEFDEMRAKQRQAAKEAREAELAAKQPTIPEGAEGEVGGPPDGWGKQQQYASLKRRRSTIFQQRHATGFQNMKSKISSFEEAKSGISQRRQSRAGSSFGGV
ncbi:uncharacterized protein [Ptychodera flava]|uniref:uncharacterized protein n=1 Tax=Ptychodera flava TaxID=63121 RepID=UPI003969E8B9